MDTKKIVVCGVGIGLVFALTFLSFPIGSIGYFHVGDAMILLFASILPAPMAFLVGAIGSSLCDLSLGYASYIIPTFIIKGSIALLASYIFQKRPKLSYGMYVLYIVILAFGYGFVDLFTTQSLAVFLQSLLMNSLQGVFSVAVYIALKKYAYPILRNMTN